MISQRARNLPFACTLSAVRALAAPIIALCVMASCADSGQVRPGSVGRVITSINGEPVVPRQANKIFIGDFEVASGDTRVAHRLVTRIRDFINTDGRLVTVRERMMAEKELTGRIASIESQAVEFGAHREPVRRRLRILTRVSLFNLSTGKTIFAERPVQAFSTFSEVVQPITPEPVALDSVIEELAKRVALQTVSGWYTERMTSVEKGR
jgi:hypothetical protein